MTVLCGEMASPKSNVWRVGVKPAPRTSVAVYSVGFDVIHPLPSLVVGEG